MFGKKYFSFGNEIEIERFLNFKAIIFDFSDEKNEESIGQICALLRSIQNRQIPFVFILLKESTKIERLIYLEFGATLVFDQETETQTPSPEEEITLVDTVYYENLTPGREYTVKGILMDKATNKPLLIDGKKVEAETTFTAEKSTGEVEVLFTFKAKDLAGKEVVAFENLYADGREVATHSDINDPSQTVKFLTPKMKSSATDQAGNKEITPEKQNKIVDTVDCSDLIPGKEYTMDGTLMDKSTGKPILVNGEEVHGKTTFISTNSTEVVEVLFDLDASELAGKEVVVYEILSRNGKQVITHEDIDDLDQTVKFVDVPAPEIPQKPDQPEKRSGILPKTGYIYSVGGTILGAILLVLSVLFYLRKKRQNSTY
ncbi:VaFE repeat-containing surface-anchored protein [Enterococcus sp. AZ126]|uniref:VaFE repeat-containing surface-anchored protein n=1 Tax=Enterococcus sp. AZ126 TaxID=2774635 RepID=UPI003F20B1DC